jgi:DNA-binding response OmpR family regulator
MADNEKKQVVLLVDDDEDFRLQQKLHLEKAGYAVIEAYSRKLAEELLKKEKPDIAIVDLMMEDKDDGFILCYHMKKMDNPIPVILVTAVTSETGYSFGASNEDERHWIKADAILAKPVRFEQLKQEIDRLLP